MGSETEKNTMLTVRKTKATSLTLTLILFLQNPSQGKVY